MAAHLMAKAALQTPMEKIWIEEYPDFIHDIVFSERCNL
jgi:hypothetical protein